MQEVGVMFENVFHRCSDLVAKSSRSDSNARSNRVRSVNMMGSTKQYVS